MSSSLSPDYTVCPSKALLCYRETFDTGPGGWSGWGGNEKGIQSLESGESTLTSRSPWWIDYNHAPPGAGYLHMLFCLNTSGKSGEHMKEVAGINQFTETGYPLDFRNATLTVRLRGELRARNAKLILLVQSIKRDICTGWMLTGQPIPISSDWATHTLHLRPEENQWTCLGARDGRSDFYGHAPLEKVLSNVNVNILFILFPLDVVPMGEIAGSPHQLRPERDYPVWRSDLPEGYVTLDDVEIRFHQDELYPEQG